VASNFIGGGSLLTSLPPTANIDIRGNVTAGQVNVTGNVFASNVTAGFFTGNGALLTGLPQSSLPSTANIDIRGNVIGNYANVVNAIVGQVNVTGTVFASNVTAGFFTGNGALLTGVTASGVAPNIGKLTGVYCVSLNGNDSTADGSENYPFLTIQAAHNRALIEYPPSTGGSISKQVEIRISPGVYTGTTNISRYNTVIRAPGSLYARGQMASIGQVNVDCGNATAVFNNTVSLENLFLTSGVTNVGNGFYTLNMDSCYIFSQSTPLININNPNSFTYINNSFISSGNSSGTYVNITGNSISIADTIIQTTASGVTSGYLINIGGTGNFSADRCYINALASNNAAIYISSATVPSGGSPFKVVISGSFIQNLLGHGIDFGTTNAAGSFIRNVLSVVSGKFVFAGNGFAYYNQQVITPTTSNSKATTVTVIPYSVF